MEVQNSAGYSYSKIKLKIQMLCQKILHFVASESSIQRSKKN
jgi:hypothetical protein